jgi:nucleoside-diphosphate-sugar epimerase
LSRKLAKDSANTITIVDNLARGFVDDDFQEFLLGPNVNFVKADLTDGNTFRALDIDYDYIYHLAGIVGVENVVNNPDEVLRANALSTLNLLDCAKNMKGLKKFLFSSTSEVYAGTLKHYTMEIPTDESVVLTLDDISSARTTYALSKIYGESSTLIYGEKHSIPVSIVRYHNIYGPRMGFAHVIPEMFVKINSSEVVDVYSPYHTRAFCYIDDAVEFTVRVALSAEIDRQILHIGNSDEEIGVRELVLKIASIMGRDITIRECPDTPGSPIRRCPDISKAVKYTGYRPSFCLEDGLRKTFEWYRGRLDRTEGLLNEKVTEKTSLGSHRFS